MFLFHHKIFFSFSYHQSFFLFSMLHFFIIPWVQFCHLFHVIHVFNILKVLFLFDPRMKSSSPYKASLQMVM